MQDEKKSKAGRKPLGKVVIMKSIKLTPELWDRAKLIGEGNASKGIRESLLAFNLKEGQEND